jgi:hypothetical protein
VAAPTAPFLERLKSRKAQVDEALERARGARRFEPEPTSAPPAPAGAHEQPAAPGATPPVPPAPPDVAAGAQGGEAELSDYASRLMKAKKKVWQDREKDQP